MQTTIDGAGRIVIPKALREQAGLRVGVPLEITLVNGVVEILPAVVATRIVDRGGLSVLVPEAAEPVTAAAVRAVLEQVRGR